MNAGKWSCYNEGMLLWTQLTELCRSLNFYVLQEKFLSVAKPCVLTWQS